MKLDDKIIEDIIRDEVDTEHTIEMETLHRNVLIVEGKTDREIMERIAYHLNLDLNFDIVEMRGVSNFMKLYDVFKRQKFLKVRYLTDNDSSARRWIEKFKIDKFKVLTKRVYSFTKPEIKEIEEYITNTPHHKNRSAKKKMLQNIWEWKNINMDNVNHLIDVIDNSFNKSGFIQKIVVS